MSAGIIVLPNREAADLLEKRQQLAAVRTRLAEREVELAQLRAQLNAFESRYVRQVGVLYAELDAVTAQIAEREADLSGSDTDRARAADACRHAQETHDAAFGSGDAEAAEEFEPPPSLKTLFREVAKRIHPDFARDEDEAKYFTLLMARANHAYTRGDTEALQRLLDDHGEINASIAGESVSAELLRISRQIRHAERDIANLDVEQHTLHGSDIFHLRLDAEAAAAQHRDLLAELADGLRQQISSARLHLESLGEQSVRHEG